MKKFKKKTKEIEESTEEEVIKAVTASSTPVPSTSAPRKKQSDPISFKNRKKQKPRVTSSDLQTLLRSDSYINDSIIEAGLFEITKKNTNWCFLSPHLFHKINSKGDTSKFVRKCNIFSFDYTIFAANVKAPGAIKENHWVAAKYSTQSHKLQLYDSKQYEDIAEETGDKIANWIDEEAKRRGHKHRYNKIQIRNISKEYPIQQDGSSCGIYMLEVMHAIVNKKDPELKNIKHTRSVWYNRLKQNYFDNLLDSESENEAEIEIEADERMDFDDIDSLIDSIDEDFFDEDMLYSEPEIH